MQARPVKYFFRCSLMLAIYYQVISTNANENYILLQLPGIKYISLYIFIQFYLN